MRLHGSAVYNGSTDLMVLAYREVAGRGMGDATVHGW